MSRLTFRMQMYISLGILLGCFVIATWTKQSLFSNLGWIIYGLFFILHPVWPAAWSWKDPQKLKLGCRIAGALAILLGLFTRFGV